MTDDELLAALRDHEPTAEAAARLAERDLYKRAVWAELDDVPGRIVDSSHDDEREAERAIAEAAGVPERAVLLDVPGRPDMPESSTRVVVNGEVRRLQDASPLVQGLQAASTVQWRLGVYAPEEHVEAVREAALETLDLPASGTRPSGDREAFV